MTANKSTKKGKNFNKGGGLTRIHTLVAIKHVIISYLNAYPTYLIVTVLVNVNYNWWLVNVVVVALQVHQPPARHPTSPPRPGAAAHYHLPPPHRYPTPRQTWIRPNVGLP